MGDQWATIPLLPLLPARPPSSIQYQRCHCQPTARPTLPTFETNILPTLPLLLPKPAASSKKQLFPFPIRLYGFPSRFVFVQTSYKAGTSPAAAATSDNCLHFARFLPTTPTAQLCRSDAKGRKQCKSNLFKKAVAAIAGGGEGGEKNRTVLLALTQPSVIYRQ